MTKRRLGLSVPLNLYEILVQQANIHGKTINSTCLDIFWNYFDSKADTRAVQGTNMNHPPEQ